MTHFTSQATEEAPYCLPYNENVSRPVLPFPPGSCDTHAHICGPESSILYDTARIYTPPDALLPAYEQMLRTLGAERMVLVQPSVYGTDNSVMLKAMDETAFPSRGIAVVPFDITDKKLEELHNYGIRGIRFNLVDIKKPGAALPLEDITRLAERIKDFRWHVEFLLHVDDYPDINAMFENFPTEIVVGHFGYFRPGCSIDNSGFQGLLQLADKGKCWVKLTGPYRISTSELPYPDIDIFGKTLVELVSHRLLWGSDWPHVMMKKIMPDDGHLADTLTRYTENENLLKQILVENPARLYHFS